MAYAKDSLKNNYILIVEDSKHDKRLLQNVLEELKVRNRIVFAEDGMEALDYIRSHREIPFMIISDINMPGMGGLDFLKAIQEDKKLREKSVPFIFLSTSDLPSEILKAYDIHVNGYFVKPWEIDMLKKTIKLIMDYWKSSELPDEKSR